MNKKEIKSGKEELVQLERYLATKPDSVMTYVDLKITAPREVTRVDSVYFNVNKWNYLQKHGLVTKNTYFLPREAK